MVDIHAEKKFQAHGKIWDENIEMQVKLWLANFAQDNVDNIVIEIPVRAS